MTVTCLRLDLIDEWDARTVNALRGARFAQVDLPAFDHNVRLGLLRQDAFRSTIRDLAVLPPGMELTRDGMRFVDTISGRVPETAGYDTLLERAAAFFSRFAGRGIAVQCSGGLDSSIIAAVLQELGIPFSLIGLSTTRYEFRTERRIQEKLCRLAREGRLIDYEQVLPMSSLESIPCHAYPSLSSLTHAAESALAAECREVGATVMISGFGGDLVLADPPPSDPAGWRVQLFNDWWLRRYVYGRHGVDLEYFFGDPGMPRDNYTSHRATIRNPFLA